MSDVLFRCRLAAAATPLPHPWEHTVGSCHAPLALRADWQAQLARCRRELGFRHVRFHGLLCDDVGTLVCHGGRLIHSFFNADRIVDFLLSIGMRPFVELSFMPAALASGGATIFSYRGNVTPPADYRAWGELTVTWDPIATALKKSADNGVAAGTTQKAVDLKGIYDLTPLNTILKSQNLAPVSAAGLGDE